ncbi:MAG TPA: MFS transporter [candidate division Zixibacteria bacterium]|nr:MFS transporter [candidate division Zixibacteria bacterium]
MESTATARNSVERRFFYGWVIVGVGFLANVASSFALASTLGIFLKPLTADLAVSRGVFSLLRSGEGLIGAVVAPLVGTLVDRFGGRWLIALGAAIAGLGYFLLGRVENFSQFAAVRLGLVTTGDALMSSMVVNVVLARWFIARRGRAMAVSSMGVGFAKVCMPVVAAWLLTRLDWRETWMVFGAATIALSVAPALLLVRRSPEEIGLLPDGGTGPVEAGGRSQRVPTDQDAVWSRAEAMRTSAFWLLVVTFGISSVGVTGLNLHVYPYVSDLGYSPVIAATVMSVIASTQLASPLAWGLLAERVDVRIAAMLRFVVQALGLGLAITTSDVVFLYAGFFLYGIGLGGNMVLPEILWANYFGRRSLGRVRGLGLLASHGMAAFGPPFFGFLYDWTKGYGLSFAIFGCALITSAFLSLLLKPPVRPRLSSGAA